MISLYAKGMTTGDIQSHLAEIYDTEISRETISKITDRDRRGHDRMAEPAARSVYPVLLINAIVIKVRDAQVANRPVYVAIGVNLDGERDVLGLWLGPTGGEGAKQWMTMLTELKNRGIADALIVCCDGFKGLPDAIRTCGRKRRCRPVSCTWSATACGTRRRSTGRPITSQMRRIYEAPTVEAAEAEFAEFADEWRDDLSGDDPFVGDELGRVRAVPRVPRRAPQDRLHDKRDREPERAGSGGRCVTAGTSPTSRPRSRSSTLSRRNAEEPREPHRPDQRLETDPQHAVRALRRPHRHHTMTTSMIQAFTQRI